MKTKLSLKSVLTTILGGAIICIVFLSCENFLNAGKVSDEIKEAIAYNNAKSVNVSIECKEDMGIVFPQLSYQVKVGYDFEIQFIPNTEKYIIKDPAKILKAESRIYKNQSREDCVEFKVKEQSYEDKRNGMYRVTVKVIKEADDILILPDCIELPFVTAVYPSIDNGYAAANTPITIDFNMSVENSNVLQKLKLLLAKDESDVSKYFEAPYLSEDKTRVIIEPKPKELQAYIKDVVKAAFAEFDINLEDNVIFQNENLEMPLSGTVEKIFKVRYKPETEEDPPKNYGFYAFTSKDSFDAAAARSYTGTKFSTAALEDFDNDTILQNRTSGTVYIYGKYYDKDSGVKTITLTEQRTNDKSGLAVSDEQVKTAVYTAKDIEFLNDGTGYTEFCIPYTLQSQDGAVLITISAIDGCNNTAAEENKSVVVIKDSGITPDDFDISNSASYITHFSMDLETYYLVSGEDYEEVATYDRTFGVIYKDLQNYYDPQKTKVYIEYSLNGTSKTVDFTVKERTVEMYHPMDYYEEYPYYGQVKTLEADLSDFTSETLAGQTIKISVKNELGNINSKEYTIPKKPIFSYAELYDDSNQYRSYYHVYFSQNSAADELYLKDSTGFYKNNSLCFVKEEGYICTYYGQFCCGRFFGPQSESFTTIPEDNSLPEIEGASISYANKPNSAETYVTVTIPQDSWNKYSSVYYFLWGERVDYEKGTFSASLAMRTSYLYSKTYEISLFGENSSGQRTKGKILTTEKLTGTELDNCKPSLGWFDDNRYSSYYQAVKDIDIQTRFDSIIAYNATDDGSGLDYFIFKTEGMNEGYRYNASDYLTKDFISNGDTYDLLIIPVWDMDDDEKINFDGAQDSRDSQGNYYPMTKSKMTVSAYDKRGNYAGGNTTFEFHYISKPEVDGITNVSDSGARYSIKFTQTNDHSDMYDYIYKLTYDDESEKYTWLKVSDSDSGNVVGSFYHHILDASINTIYKVIAEEDIYTKGYNDDTTDDYGTSEPLYICVGSNKTNTFKSSGKYDYILSLEGSDEGVLVSSDATTFVHTLVTKKSYSECKDWSTEKWEYHRRHIGDEQLDFSSADHNSQIYTIPVSEIDDGDCYVVVAHFANGKTARSRVFQK